MRLVHPIPGATLGQRYGWRPPVAGLPAGLHNGQDWPAPMGTPVRAAAAGTAYLGWEQGGFGNYVKIQVNNSTEIFNAHLSSFGVPNGSWVSQGQVIGYVGSTGASTGPHLHLSVRINGSWVDPLPLITADNPPPAPEPLPEPEEPVRQVRNGDKMFMVRYKKGNPSGGTGWLIVGTPKPEILKTVEAARGILDQWGVENSYETDRGGWLKFLRMAGMTDTEIAKLNVK